MSEIVDFRPKARYSLWAEKRGRLVALAPGYAYSDLALVERLAQKFSTKWNLLTIDRTLVWRPLDVLVVDNPDVRVLSRWRGGKKVG